MPFCIQPPRLCARLLIAAIVGVMSAGCASPIKSEFHGNHRVTKTAQSQLAPSHGFKNLPRENQKTVLPSHLLEPGDLVSLKIADVPTNLEIESGQSVLADGSLDLARFGRLIVAGMTLESTESLIEDTIANVTRETEGGENVLHVEVNVSLAESTDRFYVLGDVRTPGIYKLKGYETVLDGILLAGGVIDNSAGYEIQLARPADSQSGQILVPINYPNIAQRADPATNYQLQPGDRVYVTRSMPIAESITETITESIAKPTLARSNTGDIKTSNDPKTLSKSDEYEVQTHDGSPSESADDVSERTLAELIASDVSTDREANQNDPVDSSQDFEPESANDGDAESAENHKPRSRFRPMWVR
jgi:protein involved in polysaccharide export with SLBB domain